MDQVKYVEDSRGRPSHFKFFKSCLPQGLLGPFLNTLTHLLHYFQRKRPIADIWYVPEYASSYLQIYILHALNIAKMETESTQIIFFCHEWIILIWNTRLPEFRIFEQGTGAAFNKGLIKVAPFQGRI